MKDARDLAVSTSSAQALEHFETALTQFQQLYRRPARDDAAGTRR